MNLMLKNNYLILRGFLELKFEIKREDSPGLSYFISSISKTKNYFL